MRLSTSPNERSVGAAIHHRCAGWSGIGRRRSVCWIWGPEADRVSGGGWCGLLGWPSAGPLARGASGSGHAAPRGPGGILRARRLPGLGLPLLDVRPARVGGAAPVLGRRRLLGLWSSRRLPAALPVVPALRSSSPRGFSRLTVLPVGLAPVPPAGSPPARGVAATARRGRRLSSG